MESICCSEMVSIEDLWELDNQLWASTLGFEHNIKCKQWSNSPDGNIFQAKNIEHDYSLIYPILCYLISFHFIQSYPILTVEWVRLQIISPYVITQPFNFHTMEWILSRMTEFCTW